MITTHPSFVDGNSCRGVSDVVSCVYVLTSVCLTVSDVVLTLVWWVRVKISSLTRAVWRFLLGPVFIVLKKTLIPNKNVL